MGRLSITLTYLFYLIYITLAIPEDLTCSAVLKRDSHILNNCILSNSKIYCQTYISIPPKGVLALNSTYYMKEKSLDKEYQYCVGVEDITITKIDSLPPGVENVHRFSKISPISAGAGNFKDFYVHITFNTTASIGLLKLQPKCIGQDITELDESCINKLLISTFIVSPSDKDFAIFDFFGKVQELYFQTLNSKIEALKLGVSTEADVNSWLGYMKDAIILNIDLSNTKIKDDFVLVNLDHLEKLNLKNCSVKEMDRISFDYGAPNIEDLDMSDNLMTSPPANIKLLAHLHTLDLSGQKVQNFELGEELNALSNIKNLDLSRMLLSGLTRSSLPNSTTLEILNLSHCQLKDLYEQTFHDLPGLKSINLSNNNLTHIHPHTFEKLSPGCKIDLENNNIKSVQKLYLRDDVEISGITFERLAVVQSDAYNQGIKNIGFISNIVLLPFLFLVLLH